MYINFKYKYKKLFWILLGFILACVFIEKVYAVPSSYVYDTTEQQRVSQIWSAMEGKTMQQAGFITQDPVYTYYYAIDNTQILKQEDYPYLQVSYTYENDNIITYYFIDDIANLTWYRQMSTTNQRYIVNNNAQYHILQVRYNTSTNSIVNMRGAWILSGNYILDIKSNIDFINFDINRANNTPYMSSSFTYSILPTYLSGYKKITLTTSDRYYMLSGVSAGSVFIPIDDFNSSGGRLSYYDNDLSSQPYTSYIQDYTTTSDGLYARQDFNLSDYSGADWVMFSKYIYLEGEDDITYDIWVPDIIYDSQVTITPNESGGNSFDFNYKDSNGDIQSEQFNSIDLSQTSPLFNDFFRNFSTNTFGLASIISAPLSLIESISSSSCSPLILPLPFINGNLTLPCMYSFYQNTFGILFTLYQTITFGVVSYWVGVRFFQLIKSFKDPDHDEIEVLDL